ncbi:MAG: hypothetical protein J6F30_08080 [Cellulosilyticum sp.]|nr:hypothetical protein [Cellulosilyticum sp.]
MEIVDYASYLAWLKAYINDHLKDNEIYKDANVLSALEEVEQYIKNYCRIPRVPKALRYVWANLTLDLLRTQFPEVLEEAGGGATTDAVVTGTVSAILRGDTEVRFSAKDDDSSGGYTHKPVMDDLVYNYIGMLNRFRMWQ